MGPKLPQSSGMWDLDHLGESEKKDLGHSETIKHVRAAPDFCVVAAALGGGVSSLNLSEESVWLGLEDPEKSRLEERQDSPSSTGCTQRMDSR